jgi:hypothetical protein
MTLLRLAYFGFSGATAVAAFIAATYWYLSSRPVPNPSERPVASISDNPAIHILETQVDIGNIHAALRQAARLNAKAAIWSGIAALLGGITSLFGFL